MEKSYIIKIFPVRRKFILIEWKYFLKWYKHISLNRNLFWLNKNIFWYHIKVFLQHFSNYICYSDPSRFHSHFLMANLREIIQKQYGKHSAQMTCTRFSNQSCSTTFTSIFGWLKIIFKASFSMLFTSVIKYLDTDQSEHGKPWTRLGTLTFC